MKVHERITPAEIRQHYLDHPTASVVDAARAIGCSRLALLAALKAHGFQSKPRFRFGAQGQAQWSQLTDRDWLAGQLAMKTFHEIAKELGTTHGNVADHAKRLGLTSQFRPGRRRSVLAVGQTVGRLTLLEQRGDMWVCQCSCGEVREFSNADLVDGRVSACRKHHQLGPVRAVRDGDPKAPEYNSWRDMLRRCYDHSFPEYARYGALGLIVDEPEWIASFEAFLRDMGPKPSLDASLERVRNDQPYRRDNVRWALPLEQANNRKTNRLLTFNGRAQTLAQWCRELGLRRGTVVTRLDVHGWSVEHALTTPTRKWERKSDPSTV